MALLACANLCIHDLQTKNQDWKKTKPNVWHEQIQKEPFSRGGGQGKKKFIDFPFYFETKESVYLSSNGGGDVLMWTFLKDRPLVSCLESKVGVGFCQLHFSIGSP